MCRQASGFQGHWPTTVDLTCSTLSPLQDVHAGSSLCTHCPSHHRGHSALPKFKCHSHALCLCFFLQWVSDSGHYASIWGQVTPSVRHLACGWNWSRICSPCPWGRSTRGLLQGRSHHQPAWLPWLPQFLGCVMSSPRLGVPQKSTSLALPGFSNTAFLPGIPGAQQRGTGSCYT